MMSDYFYLQYPSMREHSPYFLHRTDLAQCSSLVALHLPLTTEHRPYLLQAPAQCSFLVALHWLPTNSHKPYFVQALDCEHSSLLLTACVFLQPPLQHQSNSVSSDSNPDSISEIYAHPSLFGLLNWYVLLPQPKANKDNLTTCYDSTVQTQYLPLVSSLPCLSQLSCNLVQAWLKLAPTL